MKSHGWFLWLPGGRAQRLDEHIVIDWCGRRFHVPLTDTTPQFGGQRFWFSCLQCGRRARIVYSPDFHCRHCSGLVHPSTRQTTAERAIRRAVQLLSVRRLHDTNRSGWWILLWFIPLIGIIVLIAWWIQQGTPGPNRFGPDPSHVGIAAV